MTASNKIQTTTAETDAKATYYIVPNEDGTFDIKRDAGIGVYEIVWMYVETLADAKSIVTRFTGVENAWTSFDGDLPVLDDPTTSEPTLADEHDWLCHRDGSVCQDGCDVVALPDDWTAPEPTEPETATYTREFASETGTETATIVETSEGFRVLEVSSIGIREKATTRLADAKKFATRGMKRRGYLASGPWTFAPVAETPEPETVTATDSEGAASRVEDWTRPDVQVVSRDLTREPASEILARDAENRATVLAISVLLARTADSVRNDDRIRDELRAISTRLDELAELALD